MHLVLWTGKTPDQLLAMDDMVVAKIPDIDDDLGLYRLVLDRQIHACGNYCRRDARINHCRFGYPFEPSNTSYFDAVNHRSVYKRADVDSHVNPYNPYLLKLLGVSMDIQINYSGRVMYYLAKYMSKVDTNINVQYGMEDAATHFAARQIGAIDAAYFLTGNNKHRSSRGTVYLSVVFPGHDERRQLRTRLDRLRSNDTNIFTPTHVQKYLNRHRQTFHLTFVEYFTCYLITKEEDVDDDVEESVLLYGNLDRQSIGREEPTELNRNINKEIPSACTCGI